MSQRIGTAWMIKESAFDLQKGKVFLSAACFPGSKAGEGRSPPVHLNLEERLGIPGAITPFLKHIVTCPGFHD
jgi:hypothetical protein